MKAPERSTVVIYTIGYFILFFLYAEVASKIVFVTKPGIMTALVSSLKCLFRACSRLVTFFLVLHLQ